MQWPEPCDDEERSIISAVERDGWRCVSVFGGRTTNVPSDRVLDTVGEGWSPPFAYTVGLARNADPEFVLVGEWAEDCRILATIVVDLIGRFGRRFAAGDETDQVFEAVPVRFGAVRDQARLALLTYADWLHHRRPFTALQVLIPDANGTWPGESGYDGTPQPLLG